MADQQNPLFSHDLYVVHRELAEICKACEERRNLPSATKCRELWDARRLRNRDLCRMDESGGAQGWSPAARFLITSARVRELCDNQCTYLGDDRTYSRWCSSLMLHGMTPISAYDVSDIILALRTISRNWTNSLFWKEGARNVCQLLEILLYDLNLRMEEIIASLDMESSLPCNAIRECVDTTALFHQVILFFMEECRNCIPVSAISIAEWQHEQSTDWTDDVKIGLANLRKYLHEEYIAISGLGRLPENVRQMLRALLLPLDIFSRFRALESIDTSSHIVASQRVLSIAEVHWLDDGMRTLPDAKLIDASDFRPYHAWLFEFVCIIKLCDILFRQHNAQFHWMDECVLIDREGCSTEDWRRSIIRRPCIYMFGITIIVAFKDSVYETRDVYEAIFIWILMVRKNGYKVQLSMQESYSLRKEIITVMDKCLPHLVE